MLPSKDAFRELAAMNRSRLAAARGAVARAAAIARAGTDLAPTAEAGVSYGQSRRASTGAAVDDYITTLLHARIPLAAGRAVEAHDRKAAAQMEAYRRELEIEKAASRTGVEEALMDFMAAQRDWKAKQATWVWRLEAMREADLRRRLLKEGGPVPDPLAVNVARFDVLEAAKNSRRVEMDLFLRFGNLWRSAGLARFLPAEIAPHAGPAGARIRPSVWVWETKKLLDAEESETAFLKRIDAIRARRVYVYLGARGELLAGEEMSQKFRSLVNAGAAAGIEFFGLLGEPEWLEQDGTEALEEAVRRAVAWNAGGGPGMTKLAGVKLDLEPHSRPGWADSAKRTALEKRYAALLACARKALPGEMPLWADVPPWYLGDGADGLRKALLASADGLTLMCYRDREDSILADAAQGLAAWRRAAEVGIEFSEKAQASERIREWTRPRLDQFLERLEREAGDRPGYAGPAFHDDAAVEAYFGAKKP